MCWRFIDTSHIYYTGTQWTDDEESDLFSVYADTSDGSDTNMDDVIKQVTSTLSSMGIQRTKQDVQSKLVQCGLIHDPNSQVCLFFTSQFCCC